MIVLFILRPGRLAASSMVAAGVLWCSDEYLRLIRARRQQRVRGMKGMRRGSPTQEQGRT